MSKKPIHWAPGSLHPICGSVRGYIHLADSEKNVTCKKCVKALKLAAKVEKVANA